MKFGRIEDYNLLAGVDFRLPEVPPATEKLLNALPTHSQEPVCYVGCSVWADRGFVGKLYPQGTPARDFLQMYAQQFNTVELNTTFYSIPSVEKVQRWKAAAKPGFKFCPKISKSISHRHNIDEPLHLLDSFLEAVHHFDAMLGMTLLQLPPYFQPSSMQPLQRFLEHIPESFPLAVEFRHPAWFSDAVAWQEICAYLRARGMTVTMSDVAGRRDVLHQTLTTDSVFVRFVGNNLHPTDYQRIDGWVQRLQQWIARGLTKIYFLLHEPEKALCVDLAMYMAQQFDTHTAPLNGNGTDKHYPKVHLPNIQAFT